MTKKEYVDMPHDVVTQGNYVARKDIGPSWRDNIPHMNAFIKASVLRHDIDMTYKLFVDDKVFSNSFKLLLNLFIPLNSLLDSFSNPFGLLVRKDDVLKEMQQKLTIKLEFIKYLRNKISGHIDTGTLQATYEWEPYVHVGTGSDTLDLAIMYKGLFDTTINSYVNDVNRNKLGLDHEFDVYYPADQDEFFSLIEEIVDQSIAYLNRVIDDVKSDMS